MKPLLLLFLFPLALLAGPTSTNSTGTVTLAWDRNTETNIAGYTIYWGPGSRQYTNSEPVGNNITGSVTNLVLNADYFFAVTASNTLGLESDFSNEVTWRASVPIPPNGIVVSNAVITFR